MMKYWLTTHYPHPIPDRHPWHIYLQRQHKSAVNGIAVGDRVLFYEYKRQKPIKGITTNLLGRQGIVRTARVSGEIYRRPTVIEYRNGTKRHWTWGIPTDQPNTGGFVRLKHLLAVIGYSPHSVLFGFNGGTGVMDLTVAQYDELLKLFKKENPSPIGRPKKG
jgi:hypothetical protein